MDTLERILNSWPGLKESYDTVKQDASDLLQGNITPQMLRNVGQVVGELPIGRIASKASSGVNSLLGKTPNQSLQAIYDMIEQKAPKLMERVKGDPKTLLGFLTPSAPRAGAAGAFNKGTNQMEIMKQGFDDTISSGVHEMSHFANQPFVAARKPGHAAETAAQLHALMPEGAGKKAAGQYMKGPEALNETLSYMAEDQLAGKLAPEVVNILKKFGVSIN